MQDLDEIDKGMLKSIIEHPGQNAIGIFRPYLKDKCETVLRHRLRKLEILGYVRSERGCVGLHYFPKEKIKKESPI
jgi:hypothetical protein